ncbi:hypothetical protein QH494_03455 [Sphingomonas sp. AR_OL41]|uniref:hypothetical protein n=1 Tax=Sphingomonas sp. AR_OL41 TaxID=3042729 RepID=UPI00247FD70A|nr:hypothetical protein [Sphingomonas sp. AR_OL41]MDH7971227.1 hypothetical protein [Sphingomonas sp. AR_OL41]
MATARRHRAIALLAGAALAALCGSVALGQDSGRNRDRPESILPPGFNDPVTTPAPAPAPAPSTSPRPQDGTVITTVPAAPLGSAPLPVPDASPTATAPVVSVDQAMLARYEVPPYARRPIGLLGAAGPADGAFGVHAFGRTDGRFLETLMRRLDTPITSRWVAIGLRRALVSRVITPPHVDGADFAAERAWLLLRMGESVAARDVVQSVDTIDYTPKLYQMAMQASLATGDPAGLCALADTGFDKTHEAGWILARGMCAGLAGQPAHATQLLTAARNDGAAGGIDLLLAQKIAGSGAGGRQSVTIEWDGVDHLNPWRLGLATAGNVAIPDSLLSGLRPEMRVWRALAPGLPSPVRARFADAAAVRGVLSSSALVDLYASVLGDDDQSLAEVGVARDLATAFNGADAPTRLGALRQLWDEPKTADGRYARLILTARAAARIPLDAADPDIDRLVAAMLTAGLDTQALRWRDKASRGSDAWAMLTLADPQRISYSFADISAYAGSDPSGQKRRMLFAGLAGLGRLPVAEIEKGARSLDIAIGSQNAWTRAISRAALAGQPGTVLLLAGIGMQTPLWRGISPEALFHIVASLRAVGLEGEARMVAVEAMTRL